jgi:2-dehydro-3-deoxygluconokinase
MISPSEADVVTIGESMVLLQPMNEGPLAYAPLFTRSIAGAESNVSIGLSRLGFKVRWISRLGTDPFGDVILSTLAGEGVDVSQVVRDSGFPTAIYFKEFKGYGDPNVYYYRKGSAISRLSPSDVQASWLEGAKHLHVTGVTPALGPETGAAIRALMVEARKLGKTISFDPNLRRKLWSEEEARRTLLSLIPLCDIFLPGIEEAEFLVGERTEAEYGAIFREMGARTVILKLGERGSIGFAGIRTVKAKPFPVTRLVDTVGAGDAFAAGFLSGFLENGNLEEDDHLLRALERANFMGSLATQYKGDWEGLPKRDELERLLSGGKEITR